MEAAKERRSSSLLPPLSYETFNAFFEAKKNTHTTNTYSYSTYTPIHTTNIYKKTHIQLNTHIWYNVYIGTTLYIGTYIGRTL